MTEVYVAINTSLRKKPSQKKTFNEHGEELFDNTSEYGQQEPRWRVRFKITYDLNHFFAIIERKKGKYRYPELTDAITKNPFFSKSHQNGGLLTSPSLLHEPKCELDIHKILKQIEAHTMACCGTGSKLEIKLVDILKDAAIKKLDSNTPNSPDNRT